MKLFLFSAFISFSALATEPFRIMIIADQDATGRANEFKTYLRQNVPPFNRMQDADLQIDIRTLSQAENNMNCQSTPGIERLVTCDSAFLQGIAGNSLAVAITSIPDVNGGSGGGIPVGTTKLPFPMMVHEMLHTAGISDEYPYETSDEQTRYCGNPQATSNYAYFKPGPPYATEGEARTRHTPDVRWMPRILAGTPIRPSAETLGTPEASLLRPGEQKIGLYRGGKCPPVDGKESWRPYPNSIMRSQESDPTVYPVYEQALVNYVRDRIGRDVPLRTRRPDDRTRLAALEVEIPVQNSVEISESADSSTVSEQ